MRELMKTLSVLVWNLPALTSISWAGYLASNERSGWGWFLGVGVILMVLPLGQQSRAD